MFNDANPTAVHDVVPSRGDDRDSIARDRQPYTPPLPSMASRKISLRSKGSLRGSFVSVREIRQIDVESHIEKSVLLWLSTHSDIDRIQEQPPAVPYIDRDGVLRQHTFDILVHFADGRRIFYAVKDERHARKHDVSGFLRHIAPQIPRTIADGVALFTERTLSPAMISNARLIHAVRRDPPHPADRAVLDLLAEIKGTVLIADLVTASTHGAAAFRAIVRLIAMRVLLLTADELIDYGSRVTVVASRIGEVA
ncbi:hypothetical protein MKK88_28065 [Methylobacterium sp. E-005]|uniref:hypothetical protein n=1 Tax=Methylobacterium sp. E-005 TaxID=2836549 RepID=UPI001FBB809E|nr:hypothetical protein [Methylobacterium sp. E-005]MCJ2089813.1 hypothetical protein [Methylobacterium sp. E-005]